jgi:hypothetical protein
MDLLMIALREPRLPIGIEIRERLQGAIGHEGLQFVRELLVDPAK